MMKPLLSKSYIDRELLKDLDTDRADILKVLILVQTVCKDRIVSRIYQAYSILFVVSGLLPY